MSIIKPQKTVIIKYLIQGFVTDIKKPTTLVPFLQNECNNINFHPHTQHRRSSHCSEERRRVVFQGCFSKSYSPSPVSGSMEYLMLNTTIRNSTKQPFHHCLTQPLCSVEKNPKPPNQNNNKTHTKQKCNQKAGFSHPECIPEAKVLFKSYSNKLHSVLHGTVNTHFLPFLPLPRQSNNDN